ncbi:MAG: right-handed parallel beta-helix repeat-containing protein, partial [Anaerolineae bacterium]|nr:right-handed parallel beta-helix repeat-containing protein [Anaerolineae bacterium]
MSTYTVNTTLDVADNTPGDDKCEATLLSGAKVCSLRAAIQEANAHAGFDFIEYTVEGTVMLEDLLPDITETVTLDHEQIDKKLTLDGRSLPAGVGINIRGSDVGLSGLRLVNFVSTSSTNPVIKISSGTNTIISDCQIGPTNSGTGVQITAGGNRIMRTVIAGNDTGVVVSGGSGSVIGPENFIGRGIPGSNATNTKAIEINGATNTKVGETDPPVWYLEGDPNVISGNTCQGVAVQSTSTSGTLILKNRIGVNATGDQALGNGCAGVYVSDGAPATTIGNNTEEGRNIISANSQGIVINQAYNVTASIRGNYIGVNATATAAMANQNTAVWIDTVGVIQITHNVIGGAPTSGSGLYIRYTLPRNLAHKIEYNYIGTNASGANFGHGLHGIEITDISGMQITNNTIRFNGGDGISTQNGGQFTINNNTITRNGGDGIDLTGSSSTITNNTVGYNGPNSAGIAVGGSSNTLTNNTVNHDIQSFQIGISINGSNNTLNNTGAAQIAGGLYGVALWGGSNTLSGYTIRDAQTGVYVEGDNNIVATGNRIFSNLIGIHVDSNAGSTQVRGNYLGVDTTGNAAAPNYEASIQINGTNTTIGGANAVDGNIISGGGSYGAAGVRITGGSGATLRYNKIGVGADGTTPVGNLYGIHVLGGTQSSIQDNVIAHNGTGILIAQGTRHAILGNSIHSNTELGIDLSPKGVTLNDTGDGDSGPNALQNFPIITLAGITGSTTRAVGTLNSLPNKTYTLRFYSSAVCDYSDHGEGTIYLGQGTVNTGADGNAAIDLSVSTAATQGHYLALTATDPDGNTSEFSACYGPLKILGSTTFSVNQGGDFTDSNIGDGVCDVSPSIGGDQCTLRAAVQQANANLGANTIVLPAGSYSLSIAGADATAAAGDLDINDALTLNGAGANTTIIQNTTTDRVFEIRNSAIVTITGVTVKGGDTTSANGAGILVNSSTTLTLDGVSIQENQTASGSGGGIYTEGTLAISNSAIISNTAGAETNGGGGIFVLSGLSTLRNVTVSANQTKGNGGGIQNLVGIVNLNNVTVAENIADSDNDGGDGGGLYTGVTTFNSKNSIIAENIDISHGAYRYGVADCSGTFTSQGYNLVGDRARATPTSTAACQGFSSTGDSVGGQWIMTNYLTWAAGLQPLALNGGATPSHAPISSASGFTVDWGNPGTPGSGGDTCEPSDQRGQARPIDGGTDGIARCDRGAVELIPAYISISDVAVTEGSTANFAVTLSAPAPITLTVQYSTTNITAIAGQDYNHTAGTLTFAPGQSSRTISVPTLTDTVNETAETFRVRLYAVQYVLTADNEGIGTLNDGSPQPSLSINDRTVTEGDTSSSTQAVFTVSLNSPSGKTVTVAYATADGTALTGEDYAATQGTLSFAPGITSRTITVNTIGDNLLEGNETFGVALSNPINATIGDATGAGTITNDDTPAFSITDASIEEGNSSTSPMVFIVELSKPGAQAVTVKYVTSPGTAQSGSDYTHTSGTLSFAAGETLKTITVQIVGDTISEANESFTVALNTPSSGTTIARGTATGTILDDGGSRVFLPLVLRN